MRRTLGLVAAAAALVAVTVAGCERRTDPTPAGPAADAPAADTRAPAARDPGAAADEAASDLDSIDRLLQEIQGDLASADAPVPDAD